MRKIVCAAIRNKDGTVVCGARHFDQTMAATISKIGGDWANAEQGFIDQNGVFVDRQEALVIAKAADQIIKRCGSDEEKLFSENIY